MSGYDSDKSIRGSTRSILESEVIRARTKFPPCIAQTRALMDALVEEVGELAKARLEHGHGSTQAKTEASHVACVAIRYMEECDHNTAAVKDTAYGDPGPGKAFREMKDRTCFTCQHEPKDHEYHVECAGCIDLEHKTLLNWTPKAEKEKERGECTATTDDGDKCNLPEGHTGPHETTYGDDKVLWHDGACKE